MRGRGRERGTKQRGREGGKQTGWKRERGKGEGGRRKRRQDVATVPWRSVRAWTGTEI